LGALNLARVYVPKQELGNEGTRELGDEGILMLGWNYFA
jgi:hypothetical protein